MTKSESPYQKPTVAVDLDGVLAQYDGWKGIYHIGDPIEGAREFLTALRENYRVVIHTTRLNCTVNLRGAVTHSHLIQQVQDWLRKHEMPYDDMHTDTGKPLAVAYIDDRAIRCQPQREMPHIAYNNALATLLYERHVAGHEWGQDQAEAAKRDV